MQKFACVLRSARVVAKESRNVYANPLVRRNVSTLYVSPSFDNNAAFGTLGSECEFVAASSNGRSGKWCRLLCH